MPSLTRVKCMLITLMVGVIPVTSWSIESQAPANKTFTLYWENDSFTGTDRDYTNGLKLTWSRPYMSIKGKKRGFKDWMMDHLPFMDKPNAQQATSISIGQNIYTPEDTSRSDLIVDERPYAGFSYVGLSFVSSNERRRDVWEIDIGILGPLSQAETVQNWVHDVIDTKKAQGWDNQLENELGLELIYEAKWRLWHTGNLRSFGVDLIPHIGGRFGNIAIYASTGAEFRFGWFMPQNYGTCPIRPGCNAGIAQMDNMGMSDNIPNRFSIHFFTAFEARIVGRDIFLDGNTFQDSHSVDKEMLVADLMGGMAVHYGRIRLSYAYTLRSREFKHQNDNHTFGALSITYRY